MAAASSAGLAASAQVIEGTPVQEYGDSMMSELGRIEAAALAARPDAERPTGIVAVNDMMALGLMAGFREAGLSVPADVSVVGMDDVFLSALMHPALTTVRLPVSEMAHTMVERVMSRLADPALPTGEFMFQPSLVTRDSVAAWTPRK
jgi:DNA-binding LacI/PurR family transcriptional regulator